MFRAINNLKTLKSKQILKIFQRNITKNEEIQWDRRIFSGIQPSGTLHLGNYFGAVERWVDFQNQGCDVIYSVVDLHSITIPQDPGELSSNILLMTASLIACGIDPKKSILFQQSMVPQHAELCWVLSCLSTMARLAHLPQYKEKKAMVKDAPLGLFAYPVLQAADILLYKATQIPVGEDQVPHLEIAQTVARMFNNRYGVTFPIPHGIIEGNSGSRLRSLREPSKKMSKSHPDQRSRIDLTDPPDSIREKIKKAVTDSTSEVTYEPESRPAVANLIALHSLATGKSTEEICCENSHLDTGRYKLVLADVLIERFNPIRLELERLQAAPDYLNEVLQEGAERAGAIAEETWLEVRQKVGFSVDQLKTRSNSLLNVGK